MVLGMEQAHIMRRIKESIGILTRKYPDKIVAVGVFGSLARGDYTDRSDVDILVIVKDWADGMERRYAIYDVIFQIIRTDISLLDIDLEDAEKLLEGEIVLTSSMLNVLYDCIIIYDPHNILQRLVDSVKRLVKKWRLVRYRVGRAYGWRFNEPNKI